VLYTLCVLCYDSINISKEASEGYKPGESRRMKTTTFAAAYFYGFAYYFSKAALRSAVHGE